MLSRPELAKAIYDTSHLTGEFRLRSGVVSREYFDKYLFEAEPALLRAIAEAMAELVPPETEVLAGLELGGVPVATALSYVSGLPAVFVRKKAKEYGTCKLAEGAAIDGRDVLIVEDVVTSGGQIVLSAKDLRARGATLSHAVCVVDREAGAAERLAAEGLALHPLFTMTDLNHAAGVAG
ncbi:MAG: orotate phosphoribosyltransferase [Candidatus Hydrogenedentes bacterium]|nr:orotate phosphoribosyltransferase [Candidatus Hydrogenedentota bacterium]